MCVCKREAIGRERGELAEKETIGREIERKNCVKEREREVF